MTDQADGQPQLVTGFPRYPMEIREGDGQSIDSFLARYPPSWNLAKVPNDYGETVETDWIWCRRGAKDKVDSMSDEQHNEVMKRAMKITAELLAKCQAIAANNDIPVRASKARGKSKAQLRAQQHDRTRDQFQRLAEETGIISGKFLFYPTDVACDAQWERIVKAMLSPDGALRDYPVTTAKIATTRDLDAGWPTRVICVYAKNSYDFATLQEIYHKLVKDVHLVPNSFKPDIFTYAGIMTGDESKIKPTIWNGKDFMPKQEMLDFFNSLKAPSAPKTQENESKRALLRGSFEDESGSETESEVEDEKETPGSETEDEIEPPPKRSKKSQVV